MSYIDLENQLPGIMQYGRESRIPVRRIPRLRELAKPRARAELFDMAIDQPSEGDYLFAFVCLTYFGHRSQ
jgi:hypothetical protein